MKKTVEIRYLRYERRYSGDVPRIVAFAQLFDQDGNLVLADTMLAQIILEVDKHGLVISNAQEMLKLLVIEQGFAS